VSTPDPVRIGNSEREAAVRQLGEHLAEGRLDTHEYEERVSAAYAARTADDLAPLFKDLPHGGGQATVAVPPGPYPAPFPSAGYPAPVHPTAGYPAHPGARDPAAPFGREPATGIPYSERHKILAGLLQLLLPIGVGRFYTGHTGMGVAQLLLSPLIIGMVWAWIDGIVILASRSVDRDGRPLRP
jgi:TM2 domain-containing membrane protein YozV